MKLLWGAIVLMFLPAVVLPLDLQGSVLTAQGKHNEESISCEIGSLPRAIQSGLKEEFGVWKVQNPTDLSPHAYERWEAEKPLRCPGIAAGQFEGDRTTSYAVLLASQSGGYKLLVFSPKAGQLTYEMRVVESGDGGAENFFIHQVRLDKFFDKLSRKKFQAYTRDGFLFVDAGAKEYETQVYFWANDNYQHQPLDY